jgi:hypothetical protein
MEQRPLTLADIDIRAKPMQVVPMTAYGAALLERLVPGSRLDESGVLGWGRCLSDAELHLVSGAMMYLYGISSECPPELAALLRESANAE